MFSLKTSTRPRTRDIDALQQCARRVRVAVMKMIHRARSGHTGGSLSCTDILVCLYRAEMRHNAIQAEWPGRDRLVLSKGHAAPALYAVLHECGYLTRGDLDRLRQLNSNLQGHPDSRRCPGVEASTGSLGQGLSVAHGMALALRNPDPDAEPRVYAVLGDGEIQEGQIWEAAMSAAHYKTKNLCTFVDLNGLQIDGAVERVMNVAPVVDKFAAFGWHTLEIDGHDFEQILGALDAARQCTDRPTAVIAHTTKGKGVSFCEGQAAWHGKAPNDEQLAQALVELGEQPPAEGGQP